ncbi:uncharacterized protein PRCAT00005162001 [Priceomyces carsonii]|uniref:uncharacterized protein n=1 Tax=Priceomyces carsonii TaxID=28549 RepID=UPI002ED9D70D|nr:unnamed protein product [Priceomyces carsonii]
MSLEEKTEKKPSETDTKVTPSSLNRDSEVDNLDDLDDLDDLLDDFADDVLSKPPGSAAAEGTKEKTSSETSPFNTNIEDLVKDLNIEDPDTKKQFEHLVKQFENEHKDDVDKLDQNPDFDSVMKDTIQRMKKSGKDIDEQLKEDPAGTNPEDMLSQLLSGLGGSGGGDMDMSKLLVDMLEQLSSKEVLYEPMKDLSSKFPDYLEEKKETLSADQHDNYKKQYEISKQIVAIFEEPEYNDDDSKKRETVNSLLEELQELGQPPTELVGDAGDFPGLGGLGGLGSGGGANDFDFSDKDIPKDLEKELEEGCKQT